jgi:hypothetical protein
MNFADLENSTDLRGLPSEERNNLANTTNANRFDNQNGRVTFGQSFDSAGTFVTPPGFKHQTEVEKNFMDDMLRGNWEQNSLSRTFFSPENIRIIQNAIRKDVYEKSGDKKYIVDDQSVDELKIIMRAIYYQYARNLETNVREQVDDLNKKVLNWSVPHILSAVDHYNYYINDISHLPVPMQQPQNISRAGTRSLPTNPFV